MKSGKFEKSNLSENQNFLFIILSDFYCRNPRSASLQRIEGESSYVNAENLISEVNYVEIPIVYDFNFRGAWPRTHYDKDQFRKTLDKNQLRNLKIKLKFSKI